VEPPGPGAGTDTATPFCVGSPRRVIALGCGAIGPAGTCGADDDGEVGGMPMMRLGAGSVLSAGTSAMRSSMVGGAVRRSRVFPIRPSRSLRSRGRSSANRPVTNFSRRAASVDGASVASQPASAERISSPVW
jgi:hypothetical protein